MNRSIGWIALGLAAALLLATGSAAAATHEVDTPAGTFYVVENHDTDGPNLHLHSTELICINNFCFGPPEPHAHAGAKAEIGVFEETNGCEGLQTSTGDCDGDGSAEDADREIAHAEQGASFCTVFPFC